MKGFFEEVNNYFSCLPPVRGRSTASGPSLLPAFTEVPMTLEILRCCQRELQRQSVMWEFLAGEKLPGSDSESAGMLQVISVRGCVRSAGMDLS